jgi:hypothetical protein
LFAKLLEFFDDLLFFDAGAGEQTLKSGGCGAQGMEIGFQNWFTFAGNVKAVGLAMPGYGDGISALQQRRHALTKFPYSYFGRRHICGLVCFMCTHYNTTAATFSYTGYRAHSTENVRLVIARNGENCESLILRTAEGVALTALVLNISIESTIISLALLNTINELQKRISSNGSRLNVPTTPKIT